MLYSKTCKGPPIPSSPYSLSVFADIMVKTDSSNRKHKHKKHISSLFIRAPLAHNGHQWQAEEHGQQDFEGCALQAASTSTWRQRGLVS